MGTRGLLVVAGAGLVIAALSGRALEKFGPPTGGFSGDSLELIALGGFRPIAIDLLQARAQLDHKQGLHYSLLADLDLLLRLQPRNDHLLAFYVSHLAFDLPPLEPSIEARRRWVRHAIDYAKKGLQQFRDSSILPAQFGVVCAVVVPRDPVLVDEFTRSEGTSPIAAAVEAFHAAAERAPDTKLYRLWEIECRRSLARDELRAGRYTKARLQFEAMREGYEILVNRFHSNQAIVARSEPENAADWAEVCRDLEGAAAGSSKRARERLARLSGEYPWDAFISEFDGSLGSE